MELTGQESGDGSGRGQGGVREERDQNARCDIFQDLLKTLRKGMRVCYVVCWPVFMAT